MILFTWTTIYAKGLFWQGFYPTPMPNPFYDQPILNSPYRRPERHWELDEAGQPTQRIQEFRRKAAYITPISKGKTQRNKAK